jgi:hypothetical protein
MSATDGLAPYDLKTFELESAGVSIEEEVAKWLQLLLHGA